ncbi:MULTISPECIES: hypothetical protein [Modicisalibacter]|uniref:hypothetical protein n=1 Tax=Modicisalibacter TaxID=574347 RepID=UPI00100A9682|nr:MULTISPECIES: hypothetical protein [Halomonadaceae]MBZ9558882.1 hypothetical protein [Modicisalibacter sp. R2A 31.J]MBZ9575226.1 hypothetical protein [Modicisalibacter sp. MOD 31.J]
MLKKTITWRTVPASEASQRRYEVYDSDTGSVIGVFDTQQAAENEVESMNRSDVEGLDENRRKQDADPGDG